MTLPAQDRERLATLLERVRECMLSSVQFVNEGWPHTIAAWLTLHEIQAVTGGSEAGISARLRELRKQGYVVVTGPAGTGKTYLAMAMAVALLKKKEVSRIVLVRPAVEAGEKLGFLPGDITEKVNPYLRPLYDALYDLMDFDKGQALIDNGIIEVAPLAFMRGRTLNDAFVILDEAQNTTTEQMKMFLTRLGFGSRAVITGDVTQTDLPTGRISGLVQAKHVLGQVDGIRFVRFTDVDVVRHPIVQSIVRAYDAYKPE